MTEHTPGPWAVETFGPLRVLATDEKGSFPICDVRGWGHLTGKGIGALGLDPDKAAAIQDANARLIAAAPDLLKALTDLSKMYTHAWDRVDGGLTMFGESVQRFEDAHHAAQVALHMARGEPMPVYIEDEEDAATPASRSGAE